MGRLYGARGWSLIGAMAAVLFVAFPVLDNAEALQCIVDMINARYGLSLTTGDVGTLGRQVLHDDRGEQRVPLHGQPLLAGVQRQQSAQQQEGADDQHQQAGQQRGGVVHAGGAACESICPHARQPEMEDVEKG